MPAPYEIWNTRQSLGVVRAVKPQFEYWLGDYGSQINSTSEFIDFEKLPVAGRKLAPFVRPMASGRPIYEDSSTAYRFKPAYVKLKDAIDPLAPLVKTPGVDAAMLDETSLSPNERRRIIRGQMAISHVNAIKRRQEWMAAQATIYGKVKIEGPEYAPVELDFLRDPSHTVVKTVGTRWGETGVSIFDDIQRYCDRMVDAAFGGMPKRLTLSTKAWAVVRKDAEFMEHMDVNIRNPRATVERGLISSDKVTKVGELMVGGASGAVIEVYLYRDTYVNDNGVVTPFLPDGDIILTASPEAINGYRCFGAIIDPYSNYQAVEIFARNWMEIGDPAVEYLLHQSAPLIVPINPDATLRATVVA